ncbi:multiple epidermal growth factor-like domains protein 10 [Dinothrombium tinctorium]|uniref:Multiple epidermal growth factor-like domains protein 10 n=1 Tax=Dinothrombium tinctorium TaxID=1965070 RepID=A0A3S3PTL6_9ACAR|nr:multiple epidermal growth factor-like domains protein 10 [Dinothrombium tinctorium]
MIELRLLCALCTLTAVVYSLEGPNVCSKDEEFPKEIQVQTQIPYEVKTFGWCLKPPAFRCRKTRIAYRNGFKTETRVFKKTVQVCCKGYAESGERCIPICSNACIHGRCAAPEKCDCVSGWSGATCNISCNNGKWGPRCENDCKCRNGTKCDPETGECICPPGTFGSDCVYPCNCYNDGTCDKYTGKCDCGPGYIGSMCEARCTKNRYGKDCAFVCDCLNGAECSFITGECFCPPNYHGTKCEIYNCSGNVDCSGNQLSLYSSVVEPEDNRSGSNVVLIAIICSLCLLILLVSVLLILKYKQRLHQLKHELAYVTYIAEKPKDRYDNPVYDCQQEPNIKQSVASVDSISCGMKNIKNDLGSSDPWKNNIQKAKLNTAEDDNFGACGGRSNQLDENATKDPNLNHNVYHNIDDLKSYSYKEPLYDEIKLKGVDEEENENYDHLQYDRPRTTIRPNYDYIDNFKSVSKS